MSAMVHTPSHLNEWGERVRPKWKSVKGVAVSPKLTLYMGTDWGGRRVVLGAYKKL